MNTSESVITPTAVRMTPQQRMKATLENLDIPKKQIEVYGSQIVVTSWSRNAAEQWALTLGNIAEVRGIIHSYDYAKVNKNTCLLPSTVEVWRTFARIK